MSQETYDIVCERCQIAKIGTFKPTRQITPQELFYRTHTGYLCERCGRSDPAEEVSGEDDGA